MIFFSGLSKRKVAHAGVLRSPWLPHCCLTINHSVALDHIHLFVFNSMNHLSLSGHQCCKLFVLNVKISFKWESTKSPNKHVKCISFLINHLREWLFLKLYFSSLLAFQHSSTSLPLLATRLPPVDRWINAGGSLCTCMRTNKQGPTHNIIIAL